MYIMDGNPNAEIIRESRAFDLKIVLDFYTMY